MTSQPVSHVEIERKFSLAEAGSLPDPADWPGVSSVSGERSFFLDATYFDTHDVTLAMLGITLRRRLGGTDAGWHLKLPQTQDAREEIRLPLQASDDDEIIPSALLERVSDVLGDRQVEPVCRVGTRRTEWDLRSGEVVLGITCDDYVSVQNLIDPGQDREWHEMEVELVDGDTDFLEAVTSHLARCGVPQASISSKLRAAMGTLMDGRNREA
ncbi:MAG: CYTH domain-containing protein [Allobranchiibius sp.]